MCLYIGNKNGHILKKDLVCYKKLMKNDDGTYRTPYQNFKIDRLNEEISPDTSSVDIEDYGFKYQIGAGVIHAFLTTDEELETGEIYLEAVIKAGTRFWIQDDLRQVAAEKLYITSTEIKSGTSDLTNLINEFGADIRLGDGSRCKISDLDPGRYSEVIGIYAYDDKVMSKEVLLDSIKFSKDKLKGFSGKTYESREEAEKDFSGEANTKILDKEFSDLLALDFCKKVGGYLPSIGELQKAFLNLEFINLTRMKLRLNLIPFGWFWSSTIRDEETIWCCLSIGVWYSFYWHDCGWYYGCVVSFLSSCEK